MAYGGRQMDKNNIEHEAYTPEGKEFTDLVLLIFKTNGRLMRAGDRLVRDLDLTSARWQVMGAIANQPKTVSQIARHYELTRQGVLWVVQSMKKSGIVELVENPDHRRAKLVQLSAKGREIFDLVAQRQHLWANEIGANFTVSQLEEIAKRLEKLGRLVSEEDDKVR